MNTRTHFTLSVRAEQEGRTVEQLLRAAGFSRRLIISLKKHTGSVRLNGEPVFVVVRTKTGDRLDIDLSAVREPSGIVPTELSLHIVYEDQDILVIDKPAGMPVHPSQGHYADTLCNALAYRCQQAGEPFTAHAIGRLDRDTSGLVLLARHELAACILSDTMRERHIHREYRAVCQGLLPDSGTISAPIARAHDSTIQRIVSPDGAPAVTHFRRLAYANGYSLASVRLETGRTHQIRVHMKHIGHPLPGDFLYCPEDTVIARQALHSYRLTFPHPLTGSILSFTADLPADMAAMFR
ncbi:MAG: RluA family pseudouridine synthase [Butyricicoccus sp.]